mmetsp:Transcript_32804/g.70805  ORF Transcript_32804/g.70805 Transcript_32804/m.70805 type:complete len:272 (+) Transcript_32804:261-1076(+)
MSATSAATLRKALPKACGRPASVGMPTSRLKAAMLAMPAKNFWISMSSDMSKTAALKTAPSWKTYFTSILYSKGRMPNLLNKTAPEAVTLSPVVKILKSLTNSICPFTILVPMFKAWKKEVWEGSIPVGPEGMNQSTMDVCPAFAADSLLYLPKTSRISSVVQFVAKMKPRLPWMMARSLSRPASGCSSWPFARALRIMVFLPMSTTAFPRSSNRMSCICLEEMLSTLTSSALGVFTQRSTSLAKYAFFLASFSLLGILAIPRLGFRQVVF